MMMMMMMMAVAAAVVVVVMMMMVLPQWIQPSPLLSPPLKSLHYSPPLTWPHAQLASRACARSR